MARTGYLVTIYQDINPSSPTYNQTREEKVLDSTNCPNSADANWVEDTRYCEMDDNGIQSGYEIIVYRDVEPLSSTYNQTREERVLNEETCEADNTEPEWVNIGEPFCRQMVYLPGGKMNNDGYWVQQQQDMNEYSATADQIRDIETYDVEHCPLPDTTPNYTIISENCQTILKNNELQFNGKKEVVRIDVNEYSPTYNFNIPETVIVEDLENCPRTLTYEFNTATPVLTADYSETWTSINVESTVNDDYLEYSAQVTSGSEWIRLGVIEEAKVEVELTENTGTDDRTGTVLLTQDESGNTLEITITQYAEQSTPTTYPVNWKFINNRTGGDYIKAFTVTLNNGLSFGGGGGLAPNGGWRTGTMQIPESMKNTALTVQSVNIAPLGSQTSYTYTQTPNPYYYNRGTSYLLVTVQ